MNMSIDLLLTDASAGLSMTARALAELLRTVDRFSADEVRALQIDIQACGELDERIRALVIEAYLR